MDLRQFIDMTATIAKDDFDGYLPTIMTPGDKKVSSIAGIPATVDHRTAVQEMIKARGLLSREFMVAVRSGEEIDVLWHRPGQSIESGSIVRTPKGLVPEYDAPCKWWELD